MEERRGNNRVPFRKAVQYFIPDKSAAGSLVQSGGCLGCNISTKGLRFYAQDFFPPATMVHLTLPLLTEGSLTVAGYVAWVQKVPHDENYLVGVRFDDGLGNLERSRLQRYVQLHAVSNAHGL